MVSHAELNSSKTQKIKKIIKEALLLLNFLFVCGLKDINCQHHQLYI